MNMGIMITATTTITGTTIEVTSIGTGWLKTRFLGLKAKDVVRTAMQKPGFHNGVLAVNLWFQSAG